MTEKNRSDLVNDMFTAARSEFAAECRPEEGGTCNACGTITSRRSQHWNDIGGPDSLICECCWVESYICFQLSEAEAEGEQQEQQALTKDLANPDWVGECGWCGKEVNVFAHTDCPARP